MPGEYTGRSPVLHAADVTTPMLLTAGRHDRATPVGQAVEFYRALRERGVPARSWSTRRRVTGSASCPPIIDLATRMVAWFERFLPPASERPPSAGSTRAGVG